MENNFFKDIEDFTEDELFEEYRKVIAEVQSRELIEKFNHRLDN